MPEGGRGKLAGNLGVNIVGAAIPTVIMLFTVPIYLNHLGAARYGVVFIAWSLLGYLGFLDLGVSRATTNLLAKTADGAIRDGIDPGVAAADLKSRVFWSSMLCNAMTGSIGGLLLFALGRYLFLNVMKVSPAVLVEAVAVMPYIAAMLPIALMMGVSVGTAEAHERFRSLNLIQITGLALGQLLPLAAILAYGSSLTLVIPIMLAVRFATFIAVTGFAIRMAGIRRRPTFDIGAVKSLLSFGGWVTITNIISPIMTDIDQFVIGSLRSVSAIPFYAVPMNIVSRTQIIPQALVRTLFPIFSRIDREGSQQLLAKSLKNLGIVMTLVYVTAIFVGGPFLQLWLGTEMMERGASVLRMLCLGAWANGLGYVLFTALQGQGRPRAVATIHMIEVLPYLGVLWFLVHKFGVFGAAMAWTIRVICDAGLLGIAVRMDWSDLSMLLPSLGFVLLAECIADMAGYGLAAGIAAALTLNGAFLATMLTIDTGLRRGAGSLVRRVGSRLDMSTFAIIPVQAVTLLPAQAVRQDEMATVE